jgi:ABC-type microcin C transport system permease subunit YejB
MAVAGLVLGILSLIGGSIPVANAFPMWLFGILGIILSATARSKARKAGQPTGIATAGLVLSIIGTIYAFIFFLVCVVCAAGLAAYAGTFGSW